MHQNNNQSSLRVIFSAFFLLFYLVVPNVASANHTGLHSLGQAISNAVTSVVNAISNAISGGGGGNNNNSNNNSNSGSGANNNDTVIQQESGIATRDSASVLGDVLVNNLNQNGQGGVQYAYHVVSTIGGTYQVTVYQIGNGGGNNNNNNNGGPYTPPAPSCSRGGPNLVVSDIFFVRSKAATSSAVNQNQLELGITYDAIAQIRNLGCDSTASPGKFINLMPFGRNGGFPARTWIDFGNNTSNELNIVMNNVGPVAGNSTIFVRFSDITMSTLGTHGVGSVADMTSPATSCPGGGGCIIEPNDPRGNVLLENFRVIRPSINLGSFLMPNVNSINGANQSAVRTIPVGAQVGLYWTGNLVNFASCTGTTTASNGAIVNDFNGQRHIGPLSAAAILQLPTTQDHVDVSIAEPGAAGVSRTYTISCRTLGGATVTDNLQIVVQAAQGCWMNNLSTMGSSCAGICGDAGGVPSVDSNGSRCMSGESRPTAGILALGSGMPNPFKWGCIGGCLPQGPILTDVVNTIYCYRAGIPQDRGNTDLSVGCYCRVGATSTIPNNRCPVIPVVPVVPTECSDAVDNDSDRMIDALDPGCWRNPEVPTTYNPNDTTERTFVTLVPTVSNLTLKTGERLTSVPFTTRNTGVMPVTEYKYIITIGGQSRPEVTRQAALGATQTDTPPSTVSYTAPGTAGTVPVRVCVSHPDMATAACDIATITVQAYQCNDGRDNDRDTLIDNRPNQQDPGCYTNPYVLTNANYDPTDDDESNGTIIVPQPTIMTLTARDQVVRYDTPANLTYRVQATTPLNCRLEGGSMPARTFAYSLANIGTLVTSSVASNNIKSTQTFTLTCTPPAMLGVTIQPTTRTVQVEVIPQVQEI